MQRLRLSCVTMLELTEVELEFILEVNMHLFIEKRMRGGISYVNKRFSKANNKYMSIYCTCGCK